MNPPRLVAVACVLLVVLALLGRLLSNPVMEEPGPPAQAGTKIAFLAAQVAAIGDFDREFNVNLENPFVPVQARRDEKEAISAPTVKVTKALPKPGPPVVVETPRLVLPPAKPLDLARPECLGVISHGRSGREVLIVRMPGGTEQQLERGSRIEEWELLSIAAGGARFRDPKGVEHEVPFVAPTPTVMRAPAATDPAGAEPPGGEPATGPGTMAPESGEPPAQTPPAPPAPEGAPMRPERPRREGARRPPPPPVEPQPAPEMVPKPPAK